MPHHFSFLHSKIFTRDKRAVPIDLVGGDQMVSIVLPQTREYFCQEAHYRMLMTRDDKSRLCSLSLELPRGESPMLGFGIGELRLVSPLQKPFSSAVYY